jgi:predicted alpha/beta-hydrolase family hydrolase
MAARRRPVEAVLLAPGAGASADHHTLVALAEALAPIPVRRMDFPYRLAGRRAPDRAPVLLDAVRSELAQLCDDVGTTPDRVVLGGRSMGGRMCSMVVADGTPAAGLVLLSYPLHPPGKPDKLRVEHLPSIDVPCLFVSGDRDPFGTPAELEAATAAIPGPVRHVWLPGGHAPKLSVDVEIGEVVRDFVAGIRRTARRPSGSPARG